jgi:hypothetical protein
MEIILFFVVILAGVVLAMGIWYLVRRRAADVSAPEEPDGRDSDEDDVFGEAEPDWPRALRLEAAAPECAAVGRPFDVVVALLPPGERPTLPEALAAAKAPAANGHGLSLRVRIDAPGLVCHSPATQTARYGTDDAPPILVFSLSADRPGEAAARVVVEQGLAEIGRVRLALRVADDAPEGGPNVGRRSTVTPRRPEAARHLLAHAIAGSYTAAELASLAEEMDAPAVAAVSPFAAAIDLVHHVARHGDAEALAVRVTTERPQWRAAIRGNRRAEKLM